MGAALTNRNLTPPSSSYGLQAPDSVYRAHAAHSKRPAPQELSRSRPDRSIACWRPALQATNSTVALPGPSDAGPNRLSRRCCSLERKVVSAVPFLRTLDPTPSPGPLLYKNPSPVCLCQGPNAAQCYPYKTKGIPLPKTTVRPILPPHQHHTHTQIESGLKVGGELPGWLDISINRIYLLLSEKMHTQKCQKLGPKLL